MEKREKAWYVGQRAELMAQLFLQELGASVWTTPGGAGPFDSIAAFLTEDQKLRLSAIEVKSTEQPVGREFHFEASQQSIHTLQHSNVPVLFLVVDVKHNELFYGWAKDVHYASSARKGKQTVRCTLPVVPASEGKEELLKTILSQPEFSERAGVA